MSARLFALRLPLSCRVGSKSVILSQWDDHKKQQAHNGTWLVVAVDRCRWNFDSDAAIEANLERCICLTISHWES
jgi:hypothetical protein